MPETYPNSPITEAVCEFRFSPGPNWDLTIPGLIYGKVREDFPGKGKRVMQELSLTQTTEGIEQKVQRQERAVFRSEDEKATIQVGDNLVAVSLFRPYTKWDEFRSRIQSAFEALRETIDVEGLERIGLRYINRIEIPFRKFELENYLEYRPYLGDKLTRPMVELNLGTRFEFVDGRDTCRILLASAASDSENASTFILDLDYFLAKPQTVDLDDAMNWVEQAHTTVEELFEGCITEQLRDIFREAT